MRNSIAPYLLLLLLASVSCSSQVPTGGGVPFDPHVRLVSGDVYFLAEDGRSYSLSGPYPIIKVKANSLLHVVVSVSSGFTLKGSLRIQCFGVWGLQFSRKDSMIVFDGTGITDSTWYSFPLGFSKDSAIRQDLFVTLHDSASYGFGIRVAPDSVYDPVTGRYVWVRSDEARAMTPDSVGFDDTFDRFVTFDASSF